jgi:hypothetical protein
MMEPMVFLDAQQVIGRRWSTDQSPEQARILSLARDALHFILATGQWYLFEDFLQSGASSVAPASSEEGSPELREGLGKTESFFRKLLDDPLAAKEQAQIQFILNALQFISSTRQHEAFADFIEYVEADAPPWVVASFETQKEADAWLKSHPSPPLAHILIGGSYHDVAYDRETDFRRLPRNRHLHRYLAWLKRVEPPVAHASFATREEAEAWLARQPSPARRTWVSIAGEFYLAVYYPNIHHRALFPLSLSEGYEEEAEGL